MFKILNKQILSKDVKRVDIHAPAIAAKVQAGQFVVVIPRAGSEWVSLCVTETELQRELISVIFQERDAATVHLGAIPIHEEVFRSGRWVAVEGSPSIDKTGFILCAAEGLGAALILPVCRAFKSRIQSHRDHGAEANGVTEPQMRIACQNSYHDKGRRYDGGDRRRYGQAGFGSGDVGASMRPGLDMMQGVCRITRERGSRLLFCPIPGEMRDGFAACRCVDARRSCPASNPSFDGHRVDFEYEGEQLSRTDVKRKRRSPVDCQIPGCWK